MLESKIRISVIVPAHNEEDTIGDCITGILNQDYEDKEIIVVNDGSSDRTSEIAKSLNAKVIDFDVGHSAAFARNAGAKKASGNVLYFLDADVFIEDKNFLSKMAGDFTEADAVGYRIVPGNPRTFIQKCLSIPSRQLPYSDVKRVFSNEPEDNPTRGFWAVRKEIFLELGGFNEQIFYFEDRDLHNRFFSKGYKVLYDPRLVVHSVDPKTWSEFIRQCRWNGRGLYEYYQSTGILHYKAVLFWSVYAVSGAVSFVHTLFLLLFILMNLLLAAWILKMIYKTRDLVHSLGYMTLHFIRTFIVSAELLRLFLTGGDGR